MASLTLCSQTKVVKPVRSEYNPYDPVNIRRERADYISKYGRVELHDTTVIMSDGGRFRIQTKYFCLFDSAIVVPRQFVWDDSTSSFTTHNFVCKISISTGTQTIFERTVSKIDFVDFMSIERKKYAALVSGGFYQFNRDTKEFEFGFSITIPVTDLGGHYTMFVNQNGLWRCLAK